MTRGKRADRETTAGSKGDDCGMRRVSGLSAIALAAAVLTACGNGTTTTPPTTPASTATSPTPTATTASPTPSPTPTLPAGFRCGNASGGVSHAPDWPITGPTVTAVRVGHHSSFDRFVLEFDGTVPAFTVKRQSTPTFTLDPKGTKVTLRGTRGVLITLKPENWTAYRGPSRLLPMFAYLREARMVQNFEGTMQWGLGILGTPCLRVTTLTGPPRLVVDVTAKPA